MVRLSWGEREREWRRGMKKVIYGQPKCKKWRHTERTKELLTTGFDRQGKGEEALNYAEGDLIWCSETFFFRVQPLSGGIHSWLLLVICSLSVTHHKCSLTCLTMPNIQLTHIQTHTPGSCHLSHTEHIFVTIKEHSLLKSLFVRENVKLVEIPKF